jgi:transcriptional regulator with XRE-family HTH domain
MPEWNTELREARERLGMSREALSERSGVSANSLKSYELGRRRPTRQNLSRLLTSMKLDELSRSVIFADAGFATEIPVERFREPNATRKEAVQLVRNRPWPAFLVDMRLEVLALSAAAWRLLGEPERDLQQRPSVLTVVTRREMRVRVQNLVEILSLAVKLFKHGVPEEPSLEAPGPYLSRILKQLLAGDPALIAQFAKLWETVPPLETRITGTLYDCVWNSDAGTIRFKCLITCLNAADGLYDHNWMPADARSHALLEELAAHSVDTSGEESSPRTRRRAGRVS